MAFYSLLNRGIEPESLSVEISSTFQIPSFHIIGLPSPEVAEAKERVRAAILSSGFEFPNRKIIVNLAPASVQKFGTGADLAIALSVIGGQALGLRDGDSIFAWGELGLGGEVKGLGQVSRALTAAIKVGANELWIAKEDLPRLTEARRMVRDTSALRVVALERFEDCIRAKRTPLHSLSSPLRLVSPEMTPPDLELDPALAQTLELSVTGFHHLLLLGPKGVGKSQALDWMEYLMGSLSDSNSLERAHLSELSDAQTPLSLVRRVGVHVRPAALVGSFRKDRLMPGEFSLAHEGCLMADEFPEWPRDSREALREPLERGSVHLTRLHASIDFPARFLFVANGNLCPCGGVFGKKKFEWASKCRCRLKERVSYLSRIQGPVLDRIDLIQIYDSPVLERDSKIDPIGWIRKIRGSRAELIQRFGKLPGHLSGAESERLLEQNPAWRKLLAQVRFTSLRERHKALRVALTAMTLSGATELSMEHLQDAVSRRKLPETLETEAF